MPDFDSLVAATAVADGLVVVARNTKNLANTGVTCMNPLTKP